MGHVSGRGPGEHAQLKREQAADAPDGHQIVRVVATGPEEFSIDDAEDTVNMAVAGQRYTASAWIRATPETAGQKVCIGIREFDRQRHLVGDAYSALRLSTAAYRPIRVVYKARRTGDGIDVHLDEPRSNGSAGDSFLADAISLTPGDLGSTVGPDCA